MLDALNSLKNLFESIISLVSAVFGFLPPWCVVFVGSVFVFVIGVFIYKLVRG